MAGFRTHTSFGVALGAISAIAAVSYGLTSDNQTLSLIFLAVVIGSFLPDLDSDGGTPFKAVIGGFSLICAMIAFSLLLEDNNKNIEYLLGVPLAVFVFVRYVVGGLLKNITHHRGIFHSVPAMMIASLGTMLLLERYDLSDMEKFLIACSVGIGYLGHLVLDELKSATHLNGIFLEPDKSLGSALKFFSRSGRATLLTYIFLIILVYLNYSTLADVLKFNN